MNSIHTTHPVPREVTKEKKIVKNGNIHPLKNKRKNKNIK